VPVRSDWACIAAAFAKSRPTWRRVGNLIMAYYTTPLKYDQDNIFKGDATMPYPAGHREKARQ
jgi:hypothetical protein